MMPSQRLPVALTSLDVALAALLRDLKPVAAVELPLSEALGCIAAEMPPATAYPPRDVAAVDGWALRASDLVGASSYTPLALTTAPAWVEAGDRMPEGCDCVLDSDSLDRTGAVTQVLTEAIPGQGVRRAGGDIAAGSMVAEGGRRIRSRDLLLARALRRESISVRQPRLRLVNIAGAAIAANLIAENARAAGTQLSFVETASREAAAIAGALDAGACDVLLTIGGSGAGQGDATIAALAQGGDIIAHGIAMRPGRTSAVGKLGNVPVIALPGAPDQALAAWWTLVIPVLDRLTARQPRRTVTLPLARKIASSVGIAEFALLERMQDAWLPLAVGELSLQVIARAEAWLLLPGGSEGFAAGAAVDAYMLGE